MTHTYTNAGDHTITISGIFPTIYFNNSGDKLKLISIPELGGVRWTNFEGAFSGCSNLVNVNGGDTSKVTSINQLFINAKIVKVDTSNWDTSLVTDMWKMFENAALANPDVSSWDTSSVTNMVRLFNSAKLANPDTSNWTFSNVNVFNDMLNGSGISSANFTKFLTAINSQVPTSNKTVGNVPASVEPAAS